MHFRLSSTTTLSLLLASALLVVTRTVGAATATATINLINATGISSPLGMVSFLDSPDGMVITPKLSGLPPGEHGFHIHDKGDCEPGMNEGKPAAGFAAGGHYDPAHTKKHLGPLSTAGHRGDLHVLVVDDGGHATKGVVAPHLTVEQIRGRSIIIHAAGDNYSDTPVPLGGGGARIACGVIH
jgi:Cu-Zn family superoxide dismutase